MSKRYVERIGYFGGSFDPPTLGHSDIGNSFLCQSGINKLIISPAGVHAAGKIYDVEPEHRLAITRMMVDNLQKAWGDRVILSTFEFERKEESFTYNELIRLSEVYSGAQIALLIGADCVNTFHTWHNFQQILADFAVLVHPRPYTSYSLLPGMELINAPEINGASGPVKRLIAEGGNVDSWLLPEIKDYIRANHLYGMG